MSNLRSMLTVRVGLIAVAIIVVLGGAIVAGPLLLRGPRLVSVSPADGSQHANPQAAIIVTFDQSVQSSSLTDAFQFDPPAPFTASASGGTVTIQPTGGLTYGADYRLNIGTVKNTFGRQLDQPVAVRFTTQPFVAVSGVGPKDGEKEIAESAPLTVIFDAPVVTEAQVQAAADDPRTAADLPQPLVFAPNISGAGQWLSPTRYSFSPEGGWGAATTYKVTVQEQVSADGLARMEHSYQWNFSTAASVLASARPFDQEQDVAADQPVEVRLGRDVNVASAAQRFTLTDVSSGKLVEGTVEAQADRFIFKPTAALARGGRYVAKIGAKVEATSGVAINAEALSWQFAVIGDLSITQVIPAADAVDVITTTQQIAVHFNHPVVAVVSPSAQGGQPQPLTISPAVQGVGRWLDTSTFIISPTVPLTPATRYTASVAAGLADQTGGQLRESFSWSFTTVAPLVYGSIPADAAPFVSPKDPLILVFNQPMDMASLGGAVTLRDSSGAAVAGSLAVAAKPAQVLHQGGQDTFNPFVSGFTATFTPAAPLTRGVNYILEVSTSARSANGGVALAQPYRATFTVAPLPTLLGSTPTAGAQNVGSNDSITLRFSTPMNWGSVQKNLTIDPKPTTVYTSTSESELYLYFELKAESDYTISVGAAATDIYGVALGKDTSFSFRTAPLPPSLSIVGNGHLMSYSSYAPARVPLQTVNTDSVSYDLFRVDRGRLGELLVATQDDQTWRSFAPTAGSAIKSDTLTPQGLRNRTNLTLIDMGNLDAGAYLLEARGAGQIERQLMLVSPTTLTVKRSADKLFVWAVDLASGKPTAGLSLQATTLDYADGLTKLGEVTRLGSTDADGIVQAPFAAASPYNNVYLWTADGAAFAFSTTMWSDGIDPWSFSLSATAEQQPVVGSLSTDRPIYRPGETVHIKGVLRLNNDGRYTLPTGNQFAALTISDPDGNQVYSSTLELSPFGTFSTDLPVSGGSSLGSYYMNAQLVGDNQYHNFSGSFNVSEYRKPVFEITVKPAHEDVLMGEPIAATATARYFAGGALANAPIHWRLLADPYYFSSDAAPGYQFENLEDAYASYRWFDNPQSASGEQVAEGSATTDAQGNFSLNLPAGTASDKHSRALTLDVEVTDVDGQVISGQGNVHLHAGAFYVGLRPDGYVAQIGKPQAVDLITLDPQGQPVAGRSMDVGIYQREWYSVREQGPDGRFYFTSAYTDTLQQTIPAKTDDKGRASVSFTPRLAGSYRIAATGKDDGGRTVTSSAFTWATGGNAFWGVNDSNRIDLIADRTSYKPGDTAKILVTAPYKGSSALLTIERGEVISHRLLSIAGTSELIEVPITADYAPNVYVSVVLITPAGSGNTADAPAAPDVRVGLVNLAISTEQQDLTVSVAPDKEQAGPRDSITYTVTTKDYSGKGVPAEVSLALVDKAVLTLADDPNPSLRQAFYEKRPLGVFTSQSITNLAERVNLALGAGSKGGGGGMSAPALVRRDFPDTAYWNAGLVTGADGTASVTVHLPDSLTTWRMSARGVTKETLVGQTTSDVVATKPLLVRASLPRFLTDGDQPTLQAVVQNSTASAIDASVTLGLSGADGGAGPISLKDPAVQPVSVPANGQTVVRWKATVVGAGQATVRLSVSGGSLEDALETSLPVQRYETPEVAASAGQVLDTTVETLRPSGDPARGEATLELAPSLAAGVQGGLSYLESFPYACTEQAVSAFLPNAVTYRLYKQFGVDNPALKTSLEANMVKGLQRLYVLQQLDGGWGWWESDKSQLYLSAYVVQGLTEAQKAGYSVNQSVLDRGVAYLKDSLDQSADAETGIPDASRLNTRAYTLFVLGELGQADRGRAVALYDQRAKLDIYGRAYLLMTLKGLGDDPRTTALVNDLTSTAIMRTTDAHWEEARADYWTMGSDARTTALALQALVRADPSNILVPNTVRYLMGLRNHGHWASTQETAVTLMALAEYVAQSGELKANYTYRVALNDKALKEGSVDSTNLDTPIELVVKLADLAQGTDSKLNIQRQAAAGQSGAGRLYYTLRMRSFQDAASVQALDQGVSVRREYVMVDTATLSPTGQLTSQAALGELVQVRLTLTLPEDMPYFMVEDMLPAGLEALDTSLKTTSAAARGAEITVTDSQSYWWYFGRTEVRDNRVALFSSDLPRGTYTYTYLARATTPGVFQTLPATAMRTYAPEVFGRSAGAQFTVTAP